MWFITTLKEPYKFYNKNGIPILVSEIEWTNCIYDADGDVVGECSPSVIKNKQQALLALVDDKTDALEAIDKGFY
ncbi:MULTISPECIES: hypothetical protein [Pseudoalteromonas]|jgi:hypothetical protein|uniref:hypothetical protein n=1 Tax=Pseudoalteromonas TaxID=53246 RepID=UPI001F3251AA|nr:MULTISPECIES: hypothetical protein [Pseudoalteromonas]MCF2922606.1 hypothetical protein [Pseudoalteromonas sp. APAL1]MDK9685836.1 hypothetical protein [Pseudoalteromonas shioyasakiensis]